MMTNLKAIGQRAADRGWNGGVAMLALLPLLGSFPRDRRTRGRHFRTASPSAFAGETSAPFSRPIGWNPAKAALIRRARDEYRGILTLMRTIVALTAIFALIPLVFAKDAPGKEILYPVAAVIIGGLVSSTLLDMIITPVVFHLFGEKALTRYLERKQEKEL